MIDLNSYESILVCGFSLILFLCGVGLGIAYISLKYRSNPNFYAKKN